jgi:TPR repeat protein
LAKFCHPVLIRNPSSMASIRSYRWLAGAALIAVVAARIYLRQKPDYVATEAARPLETEIRADDPAARAVVTKAIQTPFQATACRIREEHTDYTRSYTVTKRTTEIVNPDKIHIREELDGQFKSESFTDGKKLLTRNGPDAEFKEETNDVPGKIKRLAPSIGAPDAGDKMERGAEENVNGVPASIYKWESTRLYVSKRKLWIADADGRLLKFESRNKGTFAFNKIPIRIDASETITYDYDPSITITLPPAQPTPSVTPTTPPAAQTTPSVTPVTPPAAQTKQSDPDTIAELKARTDAGDAEAQYRWGRRLARGDGVTKDLTEAAKWYRKAADQNHAPSQNVLGSCYEKGEGVPQDPIEAAKWWRKAADQNDAGGLYNMAYAYTKGIGVPKDQLEAVKWMRKAADQNLAMAQARLGYWYEKGEGVAKDMVEAAKWYRKAAEQNYPEAEVDLARCYMLKDGGVPKDYVEAYKWLLLALPQGEQERCAKLMPALEDNMSPEQLDEARKRAFAPRIRAFADEANAALVSENYARVVDFTYPKAVELMGGRDEAIARLREIIDDLKDRHASITKIEVQEPDRVVASKDRLFAVVPQTIRMESAKKTVRTSSFLIAVSETAGQHWHFIDCAKLSQNPDTAREILTKIVPDFPARLALPKFEPPVAEPK